MRRWLSVVLLLLQVGGAQGGSIVTATLAAVKDAAGLRPAEAQDTRYFWKPDGFSVEDFQTATMHVNLLSREGDIGLPRVVAKDLIAVKLSSYGWQPNVYEKFAALDPWFHQELLVPAGSSYAMYWRGDAKFAKGWYRKELAKADARVIIPHRVLEKNCGKEIEALYELTNSGTPLLRWDWFFSQTAVCEDRVVGYYEMLGLKNRADAEALGGLIINVAEKRRAVMNAYLIRSKVAVNNRSIEWMQAYDGHWFKTKDNLKDTGKANAARLLNGDLDWVAEEIYGTLPNGLPLMIASNKDGTLQRIVPSKIAADSQATGLDLNIHVPLGCMRCHLEVVRPFTCNARQLYQGEIKLESPDYVKFRRLQQLYLGDIDKVVLDAQGRFAAAIKRCNGLTPAANAKAYANAWHNYMEVSLGPERVALELGIPTRRLLAVIGGKIKDGLSDPVLSNLWQQPPVEIRREYFEEAHGVLWDWLDYTP